MCFKPNAFEAEATIPPNRPMAQIPFPPKFLALTGPFHRGRRHFQVKCKNSTGRAARSAERKMEEVPPPCSSLAVSSIVNTGWAGALYALCFAPHEARTQGLSRIAVARHVARSVPIYAVQYGIVGGLFTATQCGLQRYRGWDDLASTMVSGGVAGGAIGALTRSWMVVIPTVCFISIFKVTSDYVRTN